MTDKKLSEALRQRKESGNLRSLRTSDSGVDFCSNDYLGLSRHNAIAMTDLKSPLGGSSGSRLVTGNSSKAEILEKSIAAFHGFPSGKLFGCGYMANIGLISSVVRRDDLIFFDSEVHASIRDGIILSRAKSYSFQHQDLAHLEKLLQRAPRAKRKWICIESLYSTNGSIAPLREITHLSKQYEASLIVDEAHAVGIWGPEGRGWIAEFGLQDEVFAVTITFGKALGCYGAMILGSELLGEFLINFSRPFIYTTALPTIILEAVREAYAKIPLMNQERENLFQLIDQCRALHFPVHSRSQIQKIVMPIDRSARTIAYEMRKRGFDLMPLTHPTVRIGEEGLRLSLHSFNSIEELQQCDSLLRELLI